ncbi:MAG: sugar phosphate isomerase/epimerase family protein [Eubacteriales bacterium]|nr:sugar phosphate isomerase/epimerase family protein [Eubacteriales bacterium]
MKTAINLSVCSAQMSQYDLIPLVKQAGFDGCFIDATSPEIDIAAHAERIRQNALALQSVHAPFTRVHLLWEEGDEGEAALAEQIACLEQSHAAGAPVMVCHVFIGFGEERPNEIGVERFSRLLRRAEQLGMRIAFENTEGEKYLETIREHLWSSPAAGFSIDTGHEMCYNHSRDLIAKYGDKLFATHLNDNMGITGAQITWHDDAHLFPFDGIADWPGIARRLRAVDFRGPLTFELTTKNKPDRTTHDRYAHLDPAGVLALAHEKALRFCEMMR